MLPTDCETGIALALHDDLDVHLAFVVLTNHQYVLLVPGDEKHAGARLLGDAPG